MHPEPVLRGVLTRFSVLGRVEPSQSRSGASGRRAHDNFAKSLSNALRTPIALMKPVSIQEIYHPVE